MDEQNWWQGVEPQGAEPQPAEPEEAEPQGTELPAEPETTEPETAEPQAPQEPEPQPQSYWQGGYQAPPYPRNVYTYPVVGGVPPKKKDGSRAAVIVAAAAGAVMLFCCVVIVAAQLLIAGRALENSEGYPDKTPGGDTAQDSGDDRPADSAQREEGAVYNMPEISTGKKSGQELSLVEINKRVKDSVVGILIAESGISEPQYSGSGFIISQDGYILTNEHVVDGATQVRVVLSDGVTGYNATIVGQDEPSDLAILKIEATGLSPVELGDSDELEVGEIVAAIGNPYGMELAGTLTNGIVSALNRKIPINGSYMTLIQTNASINPGNSGGPLVNAYGQVIGITSSKLVATEYEGIGFAIPINAVSDITEDLINYGYVRTRAYIGIQGVDVTKLYNVPGGLTQGIYVAEVDPSCDAAAKGLKEGDIITAFNGEEITSMEQMNEMKNAFRPGEKVTITVWRDGETFTIEITLTEAS